MTKQIPQFLADKNMSLDSLKDQISLFEEITITERIPNKFYEPPEGFQGFNEFLDDGLPNEEEIEDGINERIEDSGRICQNQTEALKRNLNDRSIDSRKDRHSINL